MQESPTVAVIGAGIAGVACAATLRDCGIKVRIYDKSRGMGGRMATRRVAPWQWDHGVQYMVGEDPEFRRLLMKLPRWTNASAKPWFVGQPSQNQLVKELAQGIELSLQTRIINIARGEDGRWIVETDAAASSSPCDAIAVAIPAPQARNLLPRTPAFAALHRVTMAPCWALLVATPELVDLPAVIESPHEHIAWFAADHSKPGRPTGNGQYVVHANSAWSKRHLEASSETAKAALLECFQDIAGDVDISYAAAHRWRYAFTETPLGQSCLFEGERLIGACGDWCLGRRVEHAFQSGLALGRALATKLET